MISSPRRRGGGNPSVTTGEAAQR